MSEVLRNFRRTTIAVFLGVAVAWALFILGQEFLIAFKGATESVKAASIAAFVTVFTFLFGRYIEQSRENKARANVEKSKSTKDFLTCTLSFL